jgi:hypothetical protein
LSAANVEELFFHLAECVTLSKRNREKITKSCHSVAQDEK